MERHVSKSVFIMAATASIATKAAIMLAGRAELGRAAAPINAVSHIAWGDKATRRDNVSVKYTAMGAALNAGAMLSWATFHEWLFRPDLRRPDAAGALLRGAATAGIAYAVDYHVVPKRLTPGFEDRLSGRGLLAIFAALAVGLAAGELLAARASDDRRF